MQQTRNHGADGGCIEAPRPHDEHPVVRPGWVGDQIREIEVQGEKCELLLSADLHDPWVGSACEPLVVNSRGVVAGFGDKRLQPSRQVLVDLEVQL